MPFNFAKDQGDRPFPFRPTLRSGELLSYWLARFALSNGLQWHEIASVLGIHKSRLGDMALAHRAKRRLSHISGLSDERLAEALPRERLDKIASFSGAFRNSHRGSPLVMRKAKSVQVCWECLEYDKMHRVEWCWTFVVACNTHGRYLSTPQACDDARMHRTSYLFLGKTSECDSGICYQREVRGTAPEIVFDAQRCFEQTLHVGSSPSPLLHHGSVFSVATSIVNEMEAKDGWATALHQCAEKRAQVIVELLARLRNYPRAYFSAQGL